MADSNMDLMLEVFPVIRGLEGLSIPVGVPEVTAETFTPELEMLELGSSVAETEVLS